MRLSPPAAASVAAHALLIAAAVFATARPGQTRVVPDRFVPLPVYLPPAPAPAPGHVGTGSGRGSPTRHDSSLPPAPAPIDLPGPVVDGGCQHACFQPDTTWDMGRGSDRSTGTSGQPETSEQVEVQATAMPGTPPPTYPPLMRDAGIGAHFVVQFIVDTTGRASPPTVLATGVDGDAGDAFLAAIRATLTHTRFRPAMIGGRPVRQLVQQQFDFVVR